MLVLAFRVMGVPYAVPVARVVEVVPRVELRSLPHAPEFLIGLLRYRGGAISVVDLGLLMGGPACRDRLDTRIILVDTGIHGVAGLGFLGLVAERVDEVVAIDPDRRAVTGLEIAGAPWLGEVYETEDGLLQMIEPGRIPAGSAPRLVLDDEPAVVP